MYRNSRYLGFDPCLRHFGVELYTVWVPGTLNPKPQTLKP